MIIPIRSLIIIVLSVVVMFSCAETMSEAHAQIADLEKKYKEEPTKESAAAYIAGVTLYAASNPKTTETENYLVQAKEYAAEQGQSVVYAGILNELLKQFPKSNKKTTRLASLIDMMDKIGKKKASQTLKYFYSKKYPSDEMSVVYNENIKEFPEEPKTYLKTLADAIFENPDVGSLNRSASFEYVDACEAFVLVNPDDEESPRFLFNAGELAKTAGTYRKALGLYDWVINNYPTHEKAPTSQFLKAFILEDNMKNIEAARENYERFIQNYPDHHFADDAKFSLENLGKSNEEIQAELEALQKKNQGK